jgi:hypothetical protein
VNTISGASLKEDELLKKGMDARDQSTNGIRCVWIFTALYISCVEQTEQESDAYEFHCGTQKETGRFEASSRVV